MYLFGGAHRKDCSISESVLVILKDIMGKGFRNMENCL